MRRLIDAKVFLALLMLGTVANAATPIDERDWIEIRSANFKIYSVLSEERSVELLRHLEVMRSSLGDTSKASTWQAGVPTTIV